MASNSGIQIYPENSFYWQYNSEPVLLLGSTDTDHLFQWTGKKLRDHLDELLSAGGNYVRNTMSDRYDECVYAFAQNDEGKYDLQRWNDEYWRRFDNFLEETEKRDIIVQIEVWDPWDTAEGHWEHHPLNPKNNVNYSEEETGVPGDFETPDPRFHDNPLYLTPPSLNDIPEVLEFQKKFVRKLLEHALEHDNVIYTIANESSLPHEFSNYWAKFIHEVAEKEGKQAFVSDMRFIVSTNPYLKVDEFNFAELSHTNILAGQAHYEKLLEERNRLAGNPCPMNVVKIYGTDDVEWTCSEEEGVRRFWRHLMAGCASARFHRPSHGLGLNGRTKKIIKTARLIQNEFNFFNAEPRNDLIEERDVNEAYLMKSASKYLIYFPEGGKVQIQNEDGLEAHWFDPQKPEQKLKGENLKKIGTPDKKQWLAVLE